MPKKSHLLAPAGKHLYLFEKEKGGVGSTGTLVTAAHMLIMRKVPIVLIEASLTQLDVKHAYGRRHTVEELDLTATDASDRLIDIVNAAPAGARILANIPGGRIEEIDAVHQTINYAQSEMGIELPTSVVWTMGRDAASRFTLDAVLAGDLPGPVLVNLPAWAGEFEDYTHVDDELVRQIEATGGTVFQTPKMPAHIYDHFRTHETAIDDLAQRPGTTMGTKVAISQWGKMADEALREIFL